jgi:L,D-peptidoglycan transpeptidase YkuD (ErfK/YbiS/YcfS/YnhG family)
VRLFAISPFSFRSKNRFTSPSLSFEHSMQKAQALVFAGKSLFLSPMPNLSRTIVVHRRPAERSRGVMVVDGVPIPVALGRGGVRANKREGDGATPRGIFRLKRLWWRADRHPRPVTRLPVRRIEHADGWCEDPRDRHYNQHVTVPKGSNADRLARNDQLYDFIIEIDHNTRPRVAGRGSAVFIHVARPGFSPTAGCVALTAPALRRLLAKVGPRTRIIVA